MSEAFRRLLNRSVASFELRVGERRSAFLLAILFFALTAAFLVARTARDALFLAHLPSSELPYVYMASALAAGLVAALVMLLRRWVPEEIFFPITAVVLGSS